MLSQTVHPGPDQASHDDGPPAGTHTASAKRKLLSKWSTSHYLRHRGLVAGAALVGLFVVVAIVGPLVAPHDPLETNLARALERPGPEHLLGTDSFGRDVFSRLLYGARVSLLVALAVVTLSLVAGVAIGTVAGFMSGTVDSLLLFVINVLLAFPGFILALAFVAVRGSSFSSVIFAIAIAYTPRVAVVMRSVVLTIRPRSFIEAAYASGVRTRTIVWRHVVPNSLPPVIVVATLSAALAILAEAGLSFLGLGVQPPTPTWGNVITDGRAYLLTQPWLSVSAGVAIALAVGGLNLLGDGLRDTLDPHLRFEADKTMFE